ncbi:MAG: hypothetical protein ACOCXA_04010, partial [Planctomycetota bacterium]
MSSLRLSSPLIACIVSGLLLNLPAEVLTQQSITASTLQQVDLTVRLGSELQSLPVFSYWAPDDAGSVWGQDHDGSYALVDGSSDKLRLSGNAWKRLDVEYQVTADTVIDVYFDSAVAAQAQGLALG